jgi:hypothetical protein
VKIATIWELRLNNSEETLSPERIAALVDKLSEVA